MACVVRPESYLLTGGPSWSLVYHHAKGPATLSARSGKSRAFF